MFDITQIYYIYYAGINRKNVNHFECVDFKYNDYINSGKNGTKLEYSLLTIVYLL